MITRAFITDYTKAVHRRSTQNVFHKKSKVKTAYTPRESSLSDTQKAEIRRKAKEDAKISWPKAIVIFCISTVLSYLLVSFFTSLFLGYWSFF